MAAGPAELDGVLPYQVDLLGADARRHAGGVQQRRARHLLDAGGAAAAQPQLAGRVGGLVAIGPLEADRRAEKTDDLVRHRHERRDVSTRRDRRPPVAATAGGGAGGGGGGGRAPRPGPGAAGGARRGAAAGAGAPGAGGPAGSAKGTGPR